MSSITCLRSITSAWIVVAIMSIGIQMITSLEPPNAAQFEIGTSTRPAVLVWTAACTASASSLEPAG
jgi:hypothetical protein